MNAGSDHCSAAEGMAVDVEVTVSGPTAVYPFHLVS